MPFLQGCFVLSFFKVAQWFWKGRLVKLQTLFPLFMKGKVYDDENADDRKKTKFCPEKLIWAFGSGDLKAATYEHWHFTLSTNS